MSFRRTLKPYFPSRPPGHPSYIKNVPYEMMYRAVARSVAKMQAGQALTHRDHKPTEQQIVDLTFQQIEQLYDGALGIIHRTRDASQAIWAQCVMRLNSTEAGRRALIQYRKYGGRL